MSGSVGVLLSRRLRPYRRPEPEVGASERHAEECVYYEGWIDSYRGRTSRGLEDTTRDEYRRSFELHVRPFGLSRQRLRDMNSRDVSEWFTELEQEGVKPPSIRKAKAALSAMLRPRRRPATFTATRRWASGSCRPTPSRTASGGR